MKTRQYLCLLKQSELPQHVTAGLLRPPLDYWRCAAGIVQGAEMHHINAQHFKATKCLHVSALLIEPSVIHKSHCKRLLPVSVFVILQRFIPKTHKLAIIVS